MRFVFVANDGCIGCQDIFIYNVSNDIFLHTWTLAWLLLPLNYTLSLACQPFHLHVATFLSSISANLAASCTSVNVLGALVFLALVRVSPETVKAFFYYLAPSIHAWNCVTFYPVASTGSYLSIKYFLSITCQFLLFLSSRLGSHSTAPSFKKCLLLIRCQFLTFPITSTVTIIHVTMKSHTFI